MGRDEVLPRGALSRIWVGVLLSAAALVISGCHWGTFHHKPFDPLPGSVMTVHEENSAGVIWMCQVREPDSTLERAKCALDVIRYVCHADPINWADCDKATSYTNTAYCRGNEGEAQNCVVSMRTAIDDVLHDQECLSFEYEVGGPSRTWHGSDRGWPGCP
jgi:hypothetical protein